MAEVVNECFSCRKSLQKDEGHFCTKNNFFVCWGCYRATKHELYCYGNTHIDDVQQKQQRQQEDVRIFLEEQEKMKIKAQRKEQAKKQQQYTGCKHMYNHIAYQDMVMLYCVYCTNMVMAQFPSTK